VQIEGQPVQLKPDDRRGAFKLIYWALRPDGITLSVTAPAGAPIHVSARDISYGLPVIPGHPYGPRPTDTMAGVSFSGEATIVSTTASFPA
jgi:hypothetical protein